MERFARLFLRLVVIGFGFLGAALCAALAHVILYRLVQPGDFGRFETAELTATIIVGTLGVAAVLAHAVAVPAFLMIAIFEFSRRRDWLSHALGGGLLPVLAGLTRLTSEPPGAGTPDIAVSIACGMIAGLAYWLVAGRTAGAWLPPRPATGA